MELLSIKDAFDRVVKKQKLSYSKTQEVLEQVYKEMEEALSKVSASDSQFDHKRVLSELKTKLKDISPVTQMEGTQKELNVASSKYTKLLEKSFNPDIAKAYRNVEFDTHTVNQIIASHLYRQGLFDIGDCLTNEAGEVEAAAEMKSSFLEMYQILEAMKDRDLTPALKWASTNRDKLNQDKSDLELKLHRMQYLEILQNRSRTEALKYARIHFSTFASNHMDEIQKLMACLLWAGKLETSPYSELLSETNWDKLTEELSRQFCNFLGHSSESPLSVTVSAGIQGLPTLLKFMTVMAGKKQEWQSMKQLPVPVELAREFQFHSIFVCPVSKDQATEDNPPMMMLCGHVLCKHSIMKMSKNSSKTFKCPYCPSDINATQCKQLYF